MGKVESPYRGLFAFGEQDAPFFFGQDEAAGEILGRLRARADAPALLVVSGISGAGKSSLLRAGVLPRIGEITPDGASWPHLMLTPARSPLSELAGQAAHRTGKDAATLRQALRDDPAGFALTALESAGAPGQGGVQRLLLVVDQFEQVFTQCGDESERRAFIAALHAAATTGHGSRQVPAALVVLVVRADFEARCAAYEELVSAVQDRYFLPPMTARQLRLAITEPARVAGSSVDNALVGELVEAFRSAPPPGATEAAPGGTGVLPYLSHALDQAWRNRAGDDLTLDDFARAGGIQGSIAASADRAYALLTPAQQEAARQVFLRLTATSANGTDTGDRASVAELTDGKNPAETGDVQAALEAFAAQRLLTLAADGVELSHEVLLTAWPLLGDTWLAETHADRIVRTQLHAAAAKWDGHGRNPAYLYRGARLAAVRQGAVRWSADPGRYPALVGADRDFLNAANRAADRASFQRRIIAAALALLLVASLTATGFAINATGTARQQTAALAASGQLAVQSEALDSTDPVTAALLAVASWRLDQSNPAAIQSLLDVYAQPDHANLNARDNSVDAVAFSRNGKFLATAGTFGKVRLWNAATLSEIGAPITIPSSNGLGAKGVAFSPDGTLLATADGDGTARLWNLSTRAQAGAPITVPSGSSNDIGANSMAFSPDGRLLAIAGSGEVRLWDVSTRARVGTPITVPISSSSGTVIAAPSGRGIGVYGVAFSPDSQTLATADDDGTVRFWDVSTRAQVGTPITVPSSSNEFGVNGVAFSPDGTLLATAGSDGIVRFWNVSTHAPAGAPITVPGDDYISAEGVAFSPDGRMLATAENDRTVRLWDVSTHAQIGAPITVPGNARVYGVAFSPDSQTLATADSDGTIRLWDLAFPANLANAACGIAGRSLTRQEWSTYVPYEPFQQVCPAS